MASLDSWLSPEVMRALAWALIHSLWQCVAVAALAAALMAFCRRPPLRYMIGVGALAVMLAVPVGTFFLLMKPAAPVQLLLAPGPALENATPAPAIVPSLLGEKAMGTLKQSTRIAPSILPWLVTAWLAGVAFFSLRFAGGFVLLEHKRRQSFAPDARILALCREIQDQLGLTGAIRYLECHWLQAPAVIGWLRPIVLLPVTALTGLSEAQLRAVIAHELAHIRRFDIFVNLFQIFVETLLFYHPAIWWLNRRIRAERELCCDEIALSLSGDRIEYARALTLMAQWERPPALAMAANRGPLTQRILHILGRKSGSAGQRMIGLTGSILFLVAAIAAANALFVVAAPPIAQARESVKIGLEAALSTMSDHARQMFPAGEPAGNDTRNATPKAEAMKDAPAEPLVPPSPGDLSQLVPKPDLSTPAIVVPLDARTASGRPAAQQPSQVLASLPPLAKTAPNKPPEIFVCSNSNIFGRVISPQAIQMPSFECQNTSIAIGLPPGKAGSCWFWSNDPFDRQLKDPRDAPGSRLSRRTPCSFGVTMNVRLADPADARLMQPGKIVRLSGDFRVSRQSRIDYLSVTNAKVIWSDPFDQAPAQLASAAPANDQPAAPAPPAAVQASLRAAPAELSIVHFCRNRSVFGQVTAADTVAIQGFTCFADSAPSDTVSARDILLGACPRASTTTSYKPKCKFDVVLNVRLAGPADAAKMIPGKLVRLGGDFRVWKEDKLDYVAVTNAKVLFTDYYWADGVSSLPLPMGPPNIANMPVQDYQPSQAPPASPPSSAPQNNQ